MAQAFRYATVALLVVAGAVRADPPAGKRGQVERPPANERLVLVAQAIAHLGNPAVSSQVALAACSRVLAERPVDPEVFWLNSRRQSAVAALQLVGMQRPIEVWSLYLGGRSCVVAWINRDPVAQVPALNPDWLRSIRDKEPFVNLQGKSRWDVLQAAWEEYSVYCQAVLNAHRTPPELFRQSAEENADITFGHMYREPWKYRGKVVSLQGKLHRVTRLDTPKPVFREGLSNFYEGWIELNLKGAPPVCVMFTELPSGIKTGDNLDQRVSFAGYFFKRYRYVAGDRKQHDTLLLIGPTLTLLEPNRTPTPEPAAFTFPVRSDVILLIFGVTAIAMAIILGLCWWLKRSDKLTKERLRQIKAGMQYDIRPEVAPSAERSTMGRDSTAAPAPPDWLRDQLEGNEVMNAAFQNLDNTDKKS